MFSCGFSAGWYDVACFYWLLSMFCDFALCGFNFFFEKLEEKSEEEKLKLLEFHKVKLSQKIIRLNKQYQKIEEVISQLKNKAIDKNSEEEK